MRMSFVQLRIATNNFSKSFIFYLASLKSFCKIFIFFSRSEFYWAIYYSRYNISDKARSKPSMDDFISEIISCY